jgi:foldase protein PrsA
VRPNPRFLALPVLLAAGALGLVACGGSEPQSSDLPAGVVAQVGDSQITKAELDRMLAQQAAAAKAGGSTFPKPGTDQYATVRQQVLQQIVLSRIVDFEAAKCGARCKVTPKEIQKQIDTIKKSAQFGGSDAKFNKFLAERKLTMKDARNLLRAQLEPQKLFNYVTRGVRYTRADALRYYRQNPAQFNVAAQRDARHILVKDKALAEKIRKQVTDANFAALAKKYSIDPGTKAQGGELGPIQRGALVPEFEKVAFSLGNNEISRPFKTQFGWHIVEVKITPARKESFAQAKSQIVAQQLQAKRNSVWTAWRDKILADYKKRTVYASPELKPPETTAAAAPATPPADTTATAPAAPASP